MSRPRLLDLFCGAGGAAMGYHRAGFEVVGVDINPQPRFPFEFIQADAMTFLDDWPVWVAELFDAIHASPPCQSYSYMSSCRPGLSGTYPDLIEAVREQLNNSGLPYVIENVPNAPLRADVTLCGHMFGLELYRHRIFESNRPLTEPDHPVHVKPGGRAGHWKPGEVISVAGNFAPAAVARKAMDIDWMNRAELGEAIPPAYTEYIGGLLS
jgi:DNA (cytosine-5)-methyltransferase 1